MDKNEISLNIITLYNPLDTPFDIIYNNKLFRTIPPKQYLRVPEEPFGKLAVKHLIDAMCNKNGKDTNDTIARESYKKIVIIEELGDPSSKIMTQDQLLQLKLDTLNRTNESKSIVICEKCNTKTYNLPEHNLLNHPIETKQEQVEPQLGTEAPVQPQTDDKLSADTILKGATITKEETAQVLPEVKDEIKVDEKIKEEIKKEPTREELIAYARDILKVQVDDPVTKKFLDEQPIEIIIKELGYNL